MDKGGRCCPETADLGRLFGMNRRRRDERDAYVERLARKLDTVPPRREPSGIFPTRDAPEDANDASPVPDRSGPVAALSGPDDGVRYGAERSAVGNLDEPFRG